MSSIAIKNTRGFQEVGLHALLGQRRIVYVCGEITEETAVSFIQEITYLNGEDEVTPITVFINSEGGDINSGMLMYDVIQSSRAPILLYCIGKAYSMAAVLLACGKKGCRYLLPHSKVMIHEPLIPHIGGKSSSVQTVSNRLLKTKREMEEVLAKHTGKTPEKIAEETKTDHFFDAEEAVQFGLVDGIRTFDEMTKEAKAS